MPARAWHVGVVCVSLAFVWQWLVVAGEFHGQWSALFLAGDRFEQSAAVKAEGSYVFAHSDGYDGQTYHAIAHDPLDLYGTDRYVDSPHVRYPRILIPGLSYVLGLGRLFWIDRAYRGFELLSVFLGATCLSKLAEKAGRSRWWGMVFLAVPAVFFSLERMLTDLPLCALILAALWSAEEQRDIVRYLRAASLSVGS